MPFGSESVEDVVSPGNVHSHATSPMPFGSESVEDANRAACAACNDQASPMPFGSESVEDPRTPIAPMKTTVVTNAFRQ